MFNTLMPRLSCAKAATSRMVPSAGGANSFVVYDMHHSTLDRSPSQEEIKSETSIPLVFLCTEDKSKKTHTTGKTLSLAVRRQARTFTLCASKKSGSSVAQSVLAKFTLGDDGLSLII